MNVSAYGLIGEEKHCFEAEFARAEVEEILEAGPEQLHDHDIVVALAAAPLERGYADAALHEPIDLGLDVQLRMLGLGALEFDGDLLVCGDVEAHVDVAERAAADLAAEAKLLTDP